LQRGDTASLFRLLGISGLSVSIEHTGIADHIVARLEQEIKTVQVQFAAPDRIPSGQVRDLYYYRHYL
jgi:hypothetical protein